MGKNQAVEYSPEYCSLLEVVYGPGMMSEGRPEGIEHMFYQIPLKNIHALDIGSGLGGVAFYLAERYAVNIVGLEVNDWMVQESQKRIPSHLKNKINFLLIASNTCWPFPDHSFDIIYSKGVLTHVQDKLELFKESLRLLKLNGKLVIVDWLSPTQGIWGKNIKKLIELEHLSLFADTETHYIATLKKSGFTAISSREAIVDSLKDASQRSRFLKHFDKETLQASIEGYQAIANALGEGELKTVQFIAQ